MPIELGDVLRVAVKFRWDDLHDIVNVWHLVVLGLGASTDDVEFMEALADMLGAWYDPPLAYVAATVLGDTLSGVNVRKDELLPVVPFAHDGGDNDDPLPLQTSPMIQWHTEVPRRGGRIYLPPVTEISQDFGVLSSAFLAVLATAAAEVLDGFTHVSTGEVAARVSYDRENDVARLLRTAFIPTVLRTQRRRRQGVGS